MTLEQSKKANQQTNFVANLKFDTKFLGFWQFFIVIALTGFGNLSGREPIKSSFQKTESSSKKSA